MDLSLCVCSRFASFWWEIISAFSEGTLLYSVESIMIPCLPAVDQSLPPIFYKDFSIPVSKDLKVLISKPTVAAEQKTF